jgi:hypothetical protein
MEPWSELPRLQEPATSPDPKPEKSNPDISLISIWLFILSSHLRLGLPTGRHPRYNCQ